MTDFLTHCLALDVGASNSRQWEEQSFGTDAEKTKESPRYDKVYTNTISISQLSRLDCSVVDVGHVIHTWSFNEILKYLSSIF